MKRVVSQVALAVAILGMTAVVSLAQQSTATSSETKSFEVLAVDGNQLVVRLPEGTRELTVPSDFRFMINGQPMSVQQLKPGMKGTATITTRTTITPVTVTEVKNGTVMQSTGSAIIVRTDEGVKSFTQSDIDKRGVKIMRDGKPATISDFRQGDRLTATIITTKPPQVLTEKEVQATLAAAATTGGGAPPASAPRAASATRAPSPSSGVSPSSPVGSSAPAQAPTSAARTLPKTASSWPFLWLASVLALAMGLALTIRRYLVS